MSFDPAVRGKTSRFVMRFSASPASDLPALVAGSNRKARKSINNRNIMESQAFSETAGSPWRVKISLPLFNDQLV